MCKQWMICLVVVCQVLGPCVAGAQVVRTQASRTQKDNVIQLRHMTLMPIPEGREPLKNRLLPRMFEMENGNAAVLYQSAAAMCPEDEDENFREKLDEWRDMTPEQLPHEEVHKALGRFRASIRLVELASVRNRCEWDMPLKEGFSMLLPSLSTFRKIAFALTVKAKLEIAEGQKDQALATIRHGLAMGRGIAEGPTLIQDLVGIAIVALMLRNVSEFMASPDAPNLYWALNDLPVPMIDLRKSLDYEYDCLSWEIPELYDLEKSVMSESQAQALVNNTFNKFKNAGVWEGNVHFLMPMAWVMIHYADSKAFLLQRGWQSARIEAMPAAQAVLTYQFVQFKEVRDNMFKWLSLPFPSYRKHSEECDQALAQVADQGIKSNLFAQYLPALSRVRFLGARLCRDIDLLCLIEALRLHAHANGNAFPKTLDDVSLVPVPNDPVTGSPFVYTYKDSQHVRVEAPACQEQTKKRPVFELTLNP